jgi:hypothetical protein
MPSPQARRFEKKDNSFSMKIVCTRKYIVYAISWQSTCHPLIWGLQIPGTMRFQGLFVIPVLSKQWTTMLVDTMLTAYYYKSPVTSRHVGWSYQLHAMIGSHDLTRMVFVLSAMILHIRLNMTF